MRTTRSDQSESVREWREELEENLRLLRLIREDPGWALSRVKRAAELEARVAFDEGRER